MDGVISNIFQREAPTPTPYTFPSGASGLIFQTREDYEVYQRNQRLAADAAAGFTTSFESYDSPVAISIGQRSTDTSLITYDAQGNASNLGERSPASFLPTATSSYTTATESLTRLLNLQVTTAEGDRVSFFSSLSTGSRQSVLDGTGLVIGTGNSASGGVPSVSIAGDLNEEEQSQINLILDATLNAVSLSERLARGEDVGEELRAAVTSLNAYRHSLSSISNFNGTIEVKESSDTEHRVTTMVAAPVPSSDSAHEYKVSDLEKEPPRSSLDLRNFLSAVLQHIDQSTAKLIEKDPKAEEKRSFLEKMRDHNKASFTSAYFSNNERVESRLLASA